MDKIGEPVKDSGSLVVSIATANAGGVVVRRPFRVLELVTVDVRDSAIVIE